jgi:hypothetical protein
MNLINKNNAVSNKELPSRIGRVEQGSIDGWSTISEAKSIVPTTKKTINQLSDEEKALYAILGFNNGQRGV